MEKLLRDTLQSGAFQNVTKDRSRMMKAVKAKNNKTTELRFCEGLMETGIQGWETQTNLFGHPDVFFPYYKIAIFLDGCFWHGCPHCGHVPKTNSLYWQTKLKRNRERDFKTTAELEHLGFKVLRFWEHEILDELESCLQIVKETIEEYLHHFVSF